MANYVEYIKAGNGEAWPVRDAEAHELISNRYDDATAYADGIGEESNRYADDILSQAKEYADAVGVEAKDYADNLNMQNSGSKWTLLWSNSGVNTSFADQSVTINNLSAYNMLLIHCRHTTNYGYTTSTIIYGQDGPPTGCVYFPAATLDGNVLAVVHRYITVHPANNTVHFRGGYRNGSADNGVCIPVAVYGTNM